MSAIAGVWHLDHKPHAYRDLGTMLTALSMYGSDDRACSNLGDAALGRCLMRILPQDQFDRQPLVVVPEQSWLVADVRLDNREELVDALALPKNSLDQSCDAGLLLAAWRRWGEACLQHLIGAFAFAVWNTRRRELFLARDHVGYRPMFLHRSNHTFAFSSMPKGLLALPQIGARLDEEQLALQLALIHGAEQRTLFAGIDRLPPGHFARVTPEALRIVRYWQPDDAPAIRFNTDRDYSAAFRERFDRVVSAQLRATSPIASHLSGGLDSSSIAATAACLLAHQGRELLALTAVPRPQFGAAPLGKFGDEGPAAARVAARHPNMHHLRVSIEKYRCLDVIQKNYLLDDRPVFNPTNGMWINAIRDIVQQRGIQVLLVGQFGNATLSYSGLDAFAEWFRRGHWWTAARCGTALIRNGYSRPRTLIAAALRPVLPAALQSQLTRRASYLQFSLVHPTLAQQTRLRERTHSSARNSADARSSARLLFQKGELADMRTGAHAGWHIDERDPTRDRRIIEFCFGIPPEQFLVGGQTRALARRAMSDRLPNATLRCRERGQQSADWHLSLAAERTGIAYELACLQRSPIARRCLDLQRMQYLIEHWPTAGFERPEVFAPWHLALTRGLAVGHFIRHFDPDVEPLHLPPPREHFHEQLPTL